MFSDEIVPTYINGPTLLLDVAGTRFLTDPTFDPKDTFYKTAVYTLHKLTDPSIAIDKMGPVDYVLLSHDHHFDNLDNAGRQFLIRVKSVFTTAAGAERLDANAIGLEHWQTTEVIAADGRIITITGTPCRHGPVGGDRGPVTGFVLNFKGDTKGAVYITGDTVWYEGVMEVARRFDISLVIAFMGAAKVKAVGDAHLTLTADEGLLVARLFDDAKIIPVHYEGWEHFSESQNLIEQKFSDAGLGDRLRWAK